MAKSEQLVPTGKCKKLAITSVKQKPIAMANALLQDQTNRISNAILVNGPDGAPSPMQFHEFVGFISDDANSAKMSPLPEVLESFSIDEKPLLWLRFIL